MKTSRTVQAGVLTGLFLFIFNNAYAADEISPLNFNISDCKQDDSSGSTNNIKCIGKGTGDQYQYIAPYGANPTWTVVQCPTGYSFVTISMGSTAQAKSIAGKATTSPQGGNPVGMFTCAKLPGKS